MARTLPISAEQPLDATRKAAGQVVTLADAQAVAVQAAASLTVAALLWPLIPAARAMAGLASALGQRQPLRPLPARLHPLPQALRPACCEPEAATWRATASGPGRAPASPVTSTASLSRSLVLRWELPGSHRARVAPGQGEAMKGR